MKLAARLLVIVGIMAFALTAVHGIFLVARDIQQAQAPAPAATAAPPVTPTPKPTPAIEKPAPTSERIREIADAPPPLEVIPPQPPPRPERKEATFSVMPGRAFNLTNRHFRKVLIRSEYPVRVYSGDCHNDYTVQWMCEGDPADLFVTDTRRWPIFATPRGNAVTVTMIEF